MTRVTQIIHDVRKYLLISVYPLPTHPTHNFTHRNGGNLETLPGWPKKFNTIDLRRAQVNNPCHKYHYVNLAMRWGTASKSAFRRWAIPKRDSSLSGHWMGHLLSYSLYSLSGGHDGAMLPINQRGLNGPLTSHFMFSSHRYFSLNTPTYYWPQMPNQYIEWSNDYNTPTLSGVMI